MNNAITVLWVSIIGGFADSYVVASYKGVPSQMGFVDVQVQAKPAKGSSGQSNVDAQSLSAQGRIVIDALKGKLRPALNKFVVAGGWLWLVLTIYACRSDQASGPIAGR